MTWADPTGIFSTLMDLTCGFGALQFGGWTNPSAQTTQLFGELAQVLQVFPHFGQSALPSI